MHLIYVANLVDDDYTTADDAGYINEFHTDTGYITALKPYKDYLAIYKNNSVQ